MNETARNSSRSYKTQDKSTDLKNEIKLNKLQHEHEQIKLQIEWDWHDTAQILKAENDSMVLLVLVKASTCMK